MKIVRFRIKRVGSYPGYSFGYIHANWWERLLIKRRIRKGANNIRSGTYWPTLAGIPAQFMICAKNRYINTRSYTIRP
jgi:hypothetical protein